MNKNTRAKDNLRSEVRNKSQQLWQRHIEAQAKEHQLQHDIGETSMNTEQIVVAISITPIIAQCFIEGGRVDVGLSQSLLVRIFRDHLQAIYPKDHVSVGYIDTSLMKLKIYTPARQANKRERIREIFRKILQRENWLIAIQ